MSTQPVFYTDTLAARAAPTRYRNIGNPYAFLSGLGIDAITEEICRGRNIVDVAETLNIGIGVLLNWMEHEGYMQKVEDASKFSSEGYLSEAARLLRQAKTDFDLKKAKEIANHGRFMASKLDKGRYGQDSKALAQTGVTFIMHMGDKSLRVEANDPNQAYSASAQRPVEIQATADMFSILPPQSLFIASQDPDIAQPDAIGPFEETGIELSSESVPDHLKDLT